MELYNTKNDIFFHKKDNFGKYLIDLILPVFYAVVKSIFEFYVVVWNFDVCRRHTTTTNSKVPIFYSLVPQVHNSTFHDLPWHLKLINLYPRRGLLSHDDLSSINSRVSGFFWVDYVNSVNNNIAQILNSNNAKCT